MGLYHLPFKNIYTIFAILQDFILKLQIHAKNEHAKIQQNMVDVFKIFKLMYANIFLRCQIYRGKKKPTKHGYTFQ